MKLFSKALFLCSVLSVVALPDVFGAPLSGTMSVNQTSDTAANAKADALDLAHRQILMNVLSQYADRGPLAELIKNTSSDDLMNLILSSSVANEQMSVNTYSANITMNIDNDAVKKWLNANDVRNWVPLAESDERFSVLVVLPNGVSDWAELKSLARGDNVEIETQAIHGNQVVAKLPLSYRTKFTAAVRGAGWRYADNDGTLQIWK